MSRKGNAMAPDPNLIRGVSDPHKSHSTLPAPSIELVHLRPYAPIPTNNYSEHSYTSNVPTSDPPTPSESISTSGSFTPPALDIASFGHPSSDSAWTINSQQLILPTPIIRQATHTSRFDEVSRTFQPYKKDVRESMTPGQASLFDALFSLARPGDEIFGGISSIADKHLIPLGPTLPTPSSVHGFVQDPACHERVTDPEDSQDADNISAKLCDTLVLDKNVESNSLPFVLQSCALWMQRFLFEAIRVIPIAREYIIGEYSMGSESRWRMFVTSKAVRAITGSTGYTLKDFDALESYMHCNMATTISGFGDDRGADSTKALSVMGTTYEFISVSLKVVPLFKVVKNMQLVAPVFRRACPDSEDRPVNLPNLLAQVNVGLQYYAILDVLLSAIINRPMNFRYDTTMMHEIQEPVFSLENGPGMRWLYGIPDKLTIILARMNGLLEDFGSSVDHKIVKELETDIRDVETATLPSADPSLAFGRLVVQECWRQVAYIYLYMGLCGADSHDARVVKVHGQFMEIFKRTKPGRIPDSFLVLPLPIIGTATRHPEDQELLKRRMLRLPECSRKGTSGNQFIRMLETMWGLVNESGRPTTWSDLRLASLYVAGV
ncbi:unnamed protein product [Rhizoctonia solani]|uniref:Fungal-specific transcription factor domain protein n=1 Tax=Rhizoctonia solani TaxID=456999 RepID=A0A8H2WFC4_9AGAM|nr:unnamed protein product [Rhizoctonia solani]